MEAMLKVIAEAKEVEKAEVDEVTEKQKTDAESTCNDQADAAKTESLTEEVASCYRGITTLDATTVVDLEFEVATSVTR